MPNTKKANLKEITSELKYLNSDEQVVTHRLFNKYAKIFDGAQRNHTCTKYEIEVLEGA